MRLSNENKIPDDEIDFRSIRNRIGSFFSYIFNLYFKNIKTTILFIALSVLLSVSIKFLVPQRYKSSFIIQPNNKNEKYHLNILDDLEMLFDLRDFTTLASELKIDENVARSIKDIKKENISSQYNLLDSINSTIITLKLNDYNNFIPIQNAIISYLESNPYFLKIKETQKNNIEYKSKFLAEDITLIDSLKKEQLKNYNSINANSSNSFFLKDLIDPTKIYILSLERINQKLNNEAQKKFSESFQLVKSSVIVKKGYWPPRILILCACFTPFFLIICLLYLHYKSKRPVDTA